MNDLPIIALIGQPNVGKSSLFNRLIGRREAITAREPGTTRDRHYGVAEWFGHRWTILDTAGVLFESDELSLDEKELQAAMEAQVEVAIASAAVIALIVDGQKELSPQDIRLAALLRKHNKPSVLLVNKGDNAPLRLQAETFHTLGLSPLFPISAMHGSGVHDFVEYLMNVAPSPMNATPLPRLPRVTIVGRTNMGKSTLINTLLGEQRAIVSSVAGTTRDRIEETVTLPTGEQFLFVDTAGIRRKGKIGIGIEQFSVVRTLQAINQSDIVIQLLTVEEAPSRGDAHIAAYVQEANKTLLLVVNKADLAVEPLTKLPKAKQESVARRYFRRFVFMQRMPFYFISAKTGAGVPELLRALAAIVSNSTQRAKGSDQS